MNIEAGEGYRLLEVGETIIAGDEYSTSTGWHKVTKNFGTVVQPFHTPLRRKLPAPTPSGLGWIKCSERLPEKAGMYLCWVDDPEAAIRLRFNDWITGAPIGARWGLEQALVQNACLQVIRPSLFCRNGAKDSPNVSSGRTDVTHHSPRRFLRLP